jgi:hypothetical protein
LAVGASAILAPPLTRIDPLLLVMNNPHDAHVVWL